jgi:hypothetical protein
MASERIERLKRPRPTAAVSEIDPAAPTAVAPMKVLNPPEPIKPAKKPRGPAVKYRCGHETAAAHFAGQDCPACRNEQRRQKNAKRRAELESAPRADKYAADRLPDGARFHVAYDATAERWSGVLSIPGCGDIRSSASGVFRLLRDLDQAFRQQCRPNVADRNAADMAAEAPSP